jgi:cysteine protease ATG4
MPDWRRGDRPEEESKLISMFADHPDALFSIHRFVNCGAKSPNLRVYVTSDTSDVYEDKFTQVARDQTGRMQPTLILLGIRLGIDHITPVYWDGLRAALQYPQSVGIAG